MLESIIQLDQQLLVYLHSFGSETWDPFWLYITKQLNWWPFFLILLYLLYKKLGWKQLGLLIVILALFFTFTDQMTNLVKNSVQRLRPLNEPAIEGMVRVLKNTQSFSFFSGHASNSMGAMVILFAVLRKYYKYAWVIFFFPLLFAYTRIYLALHYPGDILCGFIFGGLSGLFFFQLFKYVNKRLNLTDKQNKNAFN